MSIDEILEFIKLLSLVVFVSAMGAQAWIAFLDIYAFFSKELERFRPEPSQDKYSRIVVVIGVLILMKG